MRPAALILRLSPGYTKRIPAATTERGPPVSSALESMTRHIDGGRRVAAATKLRMSTARNGISLVLMPTTRT